MLPMQGAWVRSLVGELRSYMSRLSQAKKQKNAKKTVIQINLFTKRNRLTNMQNKLMVTKEDSGGDKSAIWDSQIHATIYKVDKQQGPTV